MEVEVIHEVEDGSSSTFTSDDNNILITLAVSQDQSEAIRTFFTVNGWPLVEEGMTSIYMNSTRVATVREKYLENEIFSRSRNFVNGQGNLERTLKVWEKSGNMKWICQADIENLFILFKEGKTCTFS